MDNELITEENKKEVLLIMATILKMNCEGYKCCEVCPLYDRYPGYVGYCCPISVGDNPSEWAID